MKKTQWNKADIVSNVFQPTRLPLSKLAFVFATLCASVISGNALAQELSIPCDEVEKKALEEAKENEVTRITAFQPAMPIPGLSRGLEKRAPLTCLPRHLED